MVALRDRRGRRGMVRLLRNQGMERRYENEVVGFNVPDDRPARRDRPGAARPSWPAGPQQRQENAARSSTPNLRRRRRPAGRRRAPTHVYHQYTIRVPEDRDGFAARAARRARHRHRRLLPDPEPPAARRSSLDARPARDRAGRPRGALAAGAPVADRRRPGSRASPRSTPWPAPAPERGTTKGRPRSDPRAALRQVVVLRRPSWSPRRSSAISSILASSSSALAASDGALGAGRAGQLGGLVEQRVQLRVLLEVRGLEVVGPQHPQVVLDQLGALLLDEDRAGLELGVVELSVTSR